MMMRNFVGMPMMLVNVLAVIMTLATIAFVSLGTWVFTSIISGIS